MWAIQTDGDIQYFNKKSEVDEYLDEHDEDCRVIELDVPQKVTYIY
uniref:DUF5678 domain-containing protein n=1 Tax=viral metagenome TaxID=1070528 RepID=A0A6M3JLT7_9ZZZZ